MLPLFGFDISREQSAMIKLRDGICSTADLPRCNGASSAEAQAQPTSKNASTPYCRDHRKVHPRRRCSLLIGSLQLSLCILMTIQFPDDISKAAAFVSSSPRARVESKLHGKVMDEAANSLNHDTHTSTANAVDKVRNKLTLKNGNHDEVTIKQALPTDLELHQWIEQESESFANHDARHSTMEQSNEQTVQSDPHHAQSSVNLAETVIQPSLKSTISQTDEVDTKSTSKQPTTQRKPQQRRVFSGLSRTHQSLLSKTTHMRRQRFVTGKYPLYVEVKQNPTKKWLGLAESRIYLNGTSLEKSLASYDIFHWLTNTERQELHGDYEFLSVELLAEIHVKKPGYVNILPKKGAGRGILKSAEADGMFSWKSWKSRKLNQFIGNDAPDEEGERLWITGFSLTKPRGELHTIDVDTGDMCHVNDRTARAIKWPNEVASIPIQVYNTSSTNFTGDDYTNNTIRDELEDALLVTDGFLVPGKDKGGLYVVRNPGNAVSEWRVCLTDVRNFQDVTINGEEDWFYHRAVWMDLTGDGRQSILAARAKLPSILNSKNREAERTRTLGKGQLVWLERPMPHSFDVETGTPLDVDGTVFDPFNARNTPWKLRVLDEGPDVMFNVADLDPTDDTIEVIASQFFSKMLTLHSIRKGSNPKVVFQRVIDDRCGSAFSSILANLDGSKLLSNQQLETSPKVIDSGSTVVSLKRGEPFSHLLVTSHECSVGHDQETSNYGSEVTVGDAAASYPNGQSKIDGGSLFGYRVPAGMGAWKSQPWRRSVIATGFKVQGQLSNMINPGAPGFCYTFFPTKDGSEFKHGRQWNRPLIGLSGDCAESAYILRPIENAQHIDLDAEDSSTKYALMCEIKCKSTVGSLAIGYDNFYSEVAEQQSGYAKIYVPCYEQDKVLVFALGSGEGEEIADDW